MRSFSYITVGQIIRELKQEGVSISRATFYNLEREGLFESGRTVGRWRRYTEDEARIIKKLIKENYGLIESVI